MPNWQGEDLPEGIRDGFVQVKKGWEKHTMEGIFDGGECLTEVGADPLQVHPFLLIGMGKPSIGGLGGICGQPV